MVFHEVDSITDVISGHRIIIYYIEGKSAGENETILLSLGIALERLQKKNDDLLVIKFSCSSQQFGQFQELYKAEVTEIVTLFIVNNEGIPIMSQHITREELIPDVIDRISTTCKINPISRTEITKLIPLSNESLLINGSGKMTEVITDLRNVEGSHIATSLVEEIPSSNSESMPVYLSSENSMNPSSSHQSFSTQLQIRLPNGNRDTQKFDKDANLDEVRMFVNTKYKLKDFDLKTYNRQAFSQDEYEKTLQDLDLYPNGVIIVVYKNIVPFNSSGGVGTIFQKSYNIVITKTLAVFHYIHSLLMVFWNNIFPGGSGNNLPSRRAINSPHTASEQYNVKKPASKRSGNIHTLRRNDDSDDENNRYNGNSTQQK